MDELLPTLTLHRNDDLLCRVQSPLDDCLLALHIEVERHAETGASDAYMSVIGKLGETWEQFPNKGDRPTRGSLDGLALGDRVHVALSLEPKLDPPHVAWPVEDGPRPSFPSDLFFGIALRVNGEPWRTAGYRGDGSVGCILSWSTARQAGGDALLSLSVGGLQGEMHSTWIRADMCEGDEIEVEIVSVEAVDPPVMRYGMREEVCPWDQPGLDPRA
ncbi:MAG: hypothetical protein QNJ98_03420 [Planctomycetota bacterium]|nr:hypothetical protein [Planctomycetota bacterium]